MSRTVLLLSILALQGISKASCKDDILSNLRWMKEINETYLLNSTDKDNEKIVGGVESEFGRYPYQVGLLRFGLGFPYCGGTLIAPTWVLSAAHCRGASRVIIGRHDFFDFSEAYEEIQILEEIIHPNYNSWILTNDIMLVKLSWASSFAPVVVDNGDVDLRPGLDLTTIGWGKTETGEISNVLREVEVDLVSKIFCFFAYLIFPFGLFGDSTICARRTGADSCNGDSGGPLLVKGQNASTDVQVGVVSWGVGCALLFFPGVYAKVASAMDFINDHVLFD